MDWGFLVSSDLQINTKEVTRAVPAQDCLTRWSCHIGRIENGQVEAIYKFTPTAPKKKGSILLDTRFAPVESLR